MKYLLVILSLFAVESSVQAQTYKCSTVQKNIDTISRRIDQVLERLGVLETGYQESLQNADLRKVSEVQNAQQRAESAHARCKSTYQSSYIALQNCRQGLLQSLLGNGTCDNREKLINQRFAMCNKNADLTLQRGLTRAETNFQKTVKKSELRYSSRKATQDAKLGRFQDRLSEAQQKLPNCTVK